MHSKRGNHYNSEKSKAKEAKNSPTEGEVVRPQVLDQSYTVPKNNSMILAKRVSLFSKVQLFLSLQRVHIRQAGIKFQTPEECFPNQFHQPNNTSGKSVTCLPHHHHQSWLQKDLQELKNCKCILVCDLTPEVDKATRFSVVTI
jgi:hypothetical protein